MGQKSQKLVFRQFLVLTRTSVQACSGNQETVLRIARRDPEAVQKVVPADNLHTITHINSH